MKTGNPYITIYNPNGTPLLQTIVTKDCKRVQTLMSEDYEELSWVSNKRIAIPVGAYIFDPNNEKLSLYNIYEPEQLNESEYRYTPQFHSRIYGLWGKTPLFFYNYDPTGNTIISREPNWDLTDNARNILDYIARAIKIETGEEWGVSVAADLGGYKNLQFSNSDIVSALNALADEWETEWYADKTTKTLHLGKVSIKTAETISLKVGININPPSITDNKEGYFNRFYIFGSTRNITQEYKGANINTLVNKRLTLDPTKYPNGYIDNRKNSGEPVLSKSLIFDDIYPKSGLIIAEARPRLMFTLDSDGHKIQIGTNSKGEPIYDTYSIWYLQLKDSITGKSYKLANTDTYSNENPDGILISGKALSIHFSGGSLMGREFELAYHDAEEIITNIDGTPFNVKAGDFEILFSKDGEYIIPAQTGLIPVEGDSVILFNLRMPDEYIGNAYSELEEAALKEIALYDSDRNNYEFNSNPVAFDASEDLLNLKLGQSVNYENEGYSFETRIIHIEKKIDIPCEQVIRLGNESIKGTRQELKEEVANASKDINLISSFNQIAQNAIDSYNRAIQQMNEGFARISDMWRFDPKYENTIFSKYNVYSLGAVSAKGFLDRPEEGWGGSSKLADLLDVDLGTLSDGDSLIYDATKKRWINRKIESSGGNCGGDCGISAEDVEIILQGKSFATEQWVTQQGYLKSVAWGDVTGKPSWIGSTKPSYAWTEITDKPSWIGATKPSYAFSEIADKPTTLGGYGITDAKISNGVITLGSNTITPLTTHQPIYALTLNAGKFTAGSYTPNSSAQTFNIPTKTSHLGNDSDFMTNAKFDELFEKEIVGGTTRIKAKFGFYSVDFVSAKGVNTDGSSGEGGGKSYLSELLDVKIASPLNGQYLVYDSSTKMWRNITLNLSSYATQTWVEEKGYITSSSLSDYVKRNALKTLTIQKNGTQVGTYDTTEAKTINISDVASAATLSSHIGNDIVHITAAERTKWNNVASIMESDTDNVVNKWNEVVAFLDTYTEADTLAKLLSNKANVGDSYTKIESDGRYVNVSGDTMTGTLVVPRIDVVGTKSSTAFITADSESNLYVNIGGRTLLVLDNAAACVRPGLSYSQTFYLGTSNTRWYGIYSVLGNFSGLITASAGIKIGDVTITYDSNAKGLKVSGGGLYSDSYISARGVSSSTGGGGSLYDRLDNWTDYTSAKEGYVLSAKLGYDLYANYVGSVQTTGSGNAVTDITKSGNKITVTKGTTFLTSHQSLANYVTLNTAQTITEAKSLTKTWIFLKTAPRTSGWTGNAANGFAFYRTEDTTDTEGFMKFGVKSSSGGDGVVTDRYFYIGWGTVAYDHANNLSVCNSYFKYKNQDVLHAGNYTSYVNPANYVTALGISGNYLTWTKNGTTNNITVPYATNADKLDSYHETSFFRNLRTIDGLVAFVDITDYNAGASDYLNLESGTYRIQRSGSTEMLVNFKGDGSTTALQFKTSYSDTSALYFRKTIDGNRVSGNWRYFITDANIANQSVASASKLATARNIWGQPFDGTGKVSGNMSEVNEIEMSGHIRMKPDASGGWARGITYKDSSGTVIGYSVGAFGSGDTLTYYYYGGLTYNTSAMFIRPSGNVGIGTTDPSYKLHVVGTFYASGATTLASTLNVNGVATFTSSVKLPYSATTWINMAKRADQIIGASAQTKESAHSLFTVKSFSGNALSFGGLGDSVGFYGFYADRMTSGTNGTDFSTTWNTSTGLITHSKGLTVGGLITANGSITIPSSQKLKIGDCEITWDGAGLKFSKGIYSESFVSAKGLNSSGAGTGTGSGYNRLDDWSKYTSAMAEYVLSAKLGKDLYDNSVRTVNTTGSGNAVGSITKSGNTLTQTMVRVPVESRITTGTNIDTLPTNMPFISEINAPAGTIPIESMSWLQVFNWGSTDANYGFQMGNRYSTNGNLFIRHRTGGSWNAWRTVLDSSNYTSYVNPTDFVKKIGDTMTGALTVPRVNINNSSSDAFISAGNASNIYMSVSGKVMFLLDGANNQVRPNSGDTNLYSLGSSSVRWSNVYATTINVTSTNVVANLNADLLDGLHSSAFFQRFKVWAGKITIGQWSRICQINNYANILISVNFSQTNQASNHLYLVSCGYSSANVIQLGANRYSANSNIQIRVTNDGNATIHFVEILSDYGYNSATTQSVSIQALQLENVSTLTAYTDYTPTASGAVSKVSITSAYNKIITDVKGNADTATRLKDSFSLWGQTFYGNNVSGDMTGVGNITMTGTITQNLSSNIAINSLYAALADNTTLYNYFGKSKTSKNCGILSYSHIGDDSDSNYIALRTYSGTGLYVLANGYVGINNSVPVYNLHVSGTLFASNYIRTNVYFDRQGYGGASWNSGSGALNVAITNNSNQTPILVAYRNGTSTLATGDDRLFALELLNTGGQLNFALGGVSKLSITKSTLTSEILINAKVGIKIGDATISWDTQNLCLKVDKGFYSDSFISAKGLNSSGSGSGGSGTSYNRLDNWGDYSAEAQPWVLSAKLGYDLYTKVNSLENTKANYVTINTEQTITGKKTFVGGYNLRMTADTSNAVGFSWRKTDNTTIIANIIYHNTPQNLFINPQGSSEVWNDAVGKYSLKIGVNSLTYNTYPILTSNNYTDYVNPANFARFVGDARATDTSTIYRFLGYGFKAKDETWYTTGPAMGFGANNSYFKLLHGSYGSNDLYIRTYNNGTWTDWKEFAFTSSNVASATKLQTTHKIWGQDFNGTQDVSGILYLGGSRIAFTDNTDVCLIINNDRLCFGNGTARGVNAGSLLVSSAWADYTKVPTNGIYSRGQIASGVATGTAPFTVASTTLVTNLNADLLDGLHVDSIRGLRTTYPNLTTTQVGTIIPSLLGPVNGYPLYTDPDFAVGNNSVSSYNISTSTGTVTVTRIADDQNSANSSGYILKITSYGTTSPGCGGFAQNMTSRANAIFLQVFRAKIPVGYSVQNNENTMGSGFKTSWLTSTDGTGKWEWYARLTICGSTGTFSSGGHVSLTGTQGTTSAPVVWYLASCNTYDLTKSNYNGGLRARYADFADSLSKTVSLWGQNFDGSGNVSGDMTGVRNVLTTGDNIHGVGKYGGYFLYNGIREGEALAIEVGSTDGGWVTNGITLKMNGNVGIGTTSPSYKLHVAGTICGSSTATFASTVQGTRLISTIATGTAPLSVSSTTVVTNLNADLLDGYHSSSMLLLKNAQSNETSIYDLGWNFGNMNSGDYGGSYASEYPSLYGRYISLVNATSGSGSAALLFISTMSGEVGRVYINARQAGSVNTKFIGWQKLAYLTDNVASATQLQNTRTLWGQDFNGTADVKGHIKNVYNITPDTNAVYTCGTSSSVWNIVHTRQVISDSILYLNSAASSNILFKIGTTEVARIQPSGLFGIGTTTPSYRLHVQGTSFINSSLILANNTTKASATSGSIQIGRATISWDNANECLKVDTGIYSDSFMSAKGVNLKSEGTNDKIVVDTLGTVFFDGNYNKTASNIYSIRLGVIDATSTGAMVQSIRTYAGGTIYQELMLNPMGGNVRIGGINNSSVSYKLMVYGTIGAQGAISQNVSSDERLKQSFGREDYISIIHSLGDVVTYRYKDKAVEGKDWLDTETRHTGLIYQNAMKAQIPDFTGVDEHGYGWVNFLSSDYQATILGALIQTSLAQQAIEDDVLALRTRIKELERRVKELEEA